MSLETEQQEVVIDPEAWSREPRDLRSALRQMPGRAYRRCLYLAVACGFAAGAFAGALVGWLT